MTTAMPGRSMPSQRTLRGLETQMVVHMPTVVDAAFRRALVGIERLEQMSHGLGWVMAHSSPGVTRLEAVEGPAVVGARVSILRARMESTSISDGFLIADGNCSLVTRGIAESQLPERLWPEIYAVLRYNWEDFMQPFAARVREGADLFITRLGVLVLFDCITREANEALFLTPLATTRHALLAQRQQAQTALNELLPDTVGTRGVDFVLTDEDRLEPHIAIE